jgi:D-3-phosphoglycerate dehydrogenase / 2-oxoglutarate reductase
MYKVQVFNKVSETGLCRFPEDKFVIGDEILDESDVILVRSYSLHDTELPESVKAIGRAGAGVNNIPIEKCSDKGVVVFNTPGANANAVKEIVISGLFLASRNIKEGINYSKTLEGKGDEVGKLVEKNKSKFAGYEIKGKTLGVIGLGAIGIMVANDAIKLGMRVQGYDPFLSVNRAWDLSNEIESAESMEKLIETSDFISIHVPLNQETKDLIDEAKIAKMKNGSVILNFSRGGLVNEDALEAALKSGKLHKYVTDFPTDKMIKCESAICIPHLGASSAEAEENCATMIVDQTKDFLLNGNIKNSVNLPDCSLERTGAARITILNKNIPSMVSQITSAFASKGINIVDMVNKSRGDMAYTIVEVSEVPSDDIVKKLEEIEGVIKARRI